MKGCFLWIKVTTKAARNEIAGYEGEVLKIRLKAIPEKGKANQELIGFLADRLSIRREQIQLVSGQSSRKKKLCVTGASLEELHKRLGVYPAKKAT